MHPTHLIVEEVSFFSLVSVVVFSNDSVTSKVLSVTSVKQMMPLIHDYTLYISILYCQVSSAYTLNSYFDGVILRLI